MKLQSFLLPSVHLSRTCSELNNRGRRRENLAQKLPLGRSNWCANFHF